MGLTCSLLGHSYGESTVTREREERGSEVVTVVREVEECARCGEQRVVSENKEVTSVVDAEEVGLEEDPGGGGSAGGGGGGAAAGGISPSGSGQGAGTFNQDTFEPPDSPEEEDAEIIEAGDDERAPGEWPSEPDEPSDESDAEPVPTEEPAADAADTTDANDAQPDDQATILDDDADPGDDAPAGTDPAQRSLDETTTADTPVEEAAAPAGEEGASTDDGTPDHDDGATVDRGGESLTVPEGAFECPECGMEVDADSSFRAGDACPECKQGYLEQVE